MRAERCIVYSSISDHRPAQAMVICVEEGQLPADGLFSEKKSVSALPGSRVRVAKLGSTMRRVPVSVMKTLVTGADIKPRAGDLVLARVKHVGHQSRLHLPCGRRARLFKGSEIIVPYGNRYAVHQFEAVVPETLGECQLVAAGGVAGKVTSQHDGVRSATVLEPIGLVGNERGDIVNLNQFAMPPQAPDPKRHPLVVVVVGSEMDAGKTTTVTHIVRGLMLAGIHTAAAKVTGTGAATDYWEYVDAGAAQVLDFVDAGHASTAGLSLNELESVFLSILGNLSAGKPEAIVIEIADGLMQRETSALLTSRVFRQHVTSIVFAAGDSMGAIAGVEWLHQRGLPIVAVSGLVTASALGRQSTRLATGMPVLSRHDLLEGEAFMRLVPTAAQVAQHNNGLVYAPRTTLPQRQ